MENIKEKKNKKQSKKDQLKTLIVLLLIVILVVVGEIVYIRYKSNMQYKNEHQSSQVNNSVLI